MTKRTLAAVVTLSIVLGVAVAAQVPEYDFYPDYRAWVRTIPAGERTPGAAPERYRQRLRTEGVSEAEITRRIDLIRTKLDALETDFWNRFFTSGQSNYNAAPNAFLVTTVEHRKAGKALDVGMGEGRNALYLSKLGWDVTGIDPADKAVALAHERAAKLGLKIKSEIVDDTTFDYGRNQWDLVLYSWTRPTDAATMARVVAGMKRGGIVVFEGVRTFFTEQNGALRAFDGLRILQYEDVRAPADFFNRAEMNVIRLIAEKPAP
jgi:SAM-dependent methyltransferase